MKACCVHCVLIPPIASQALTHYIFTTAHLGDNPNVQFTDLEGGACADGHLVPGGKRRGQQPRTTGVRRSGSGSQGGRAPGVRKEPTPLSWLAHAVGCGA
jgi:hypothetical protein